jgi:hypothetical protein
MLKGKIPRRIGLRLANAALILAISAVFVRAADKPKYTIAEIMKALHKGEDSLGNRVGAGHGTKEDFAKMVDYYTSLPLDAPPVGDDASWKTKSTALLDAAKALRDGKENALAQYNKAVNCKACHSVHREE